MGDTGIQVSDTDTATPEIKTQRTRYIDIQIQFLAETKTFINFQ